MAKASAWAQLATLAPSLKEAELRVLTYLTAEAFQKGALSIRASSRTIAESARVSRRNVQYAIDGLADRGLIATREGTRTKAAAYQLRFAEILKMGGAVTTPPPHVTGEPGGAVTTPGVALIQRHGGATPTPPATENKGPETAPSVLLIDKDFDLKLDRSLPPIQQQTPRPDPAMARSDFGVCCESLPSRLRPPDRRGRGGDDHGGMQRRPAAIPQGRLRNPVRRQHAPRLADVVGHGLPTTRARHRTGDDESPPGRARSSEATTPRRQPGQSKI